MNFPERDPNESVYAEWDDEYGAYAIFGIYTGHCYAQYSDEADAEARVTEMNRARGYKACDHCAREVKKLYPHTSYDRVAFTPKKEQICGDCADYCDMEEEACERHQENPENFRFRGEGGL